MECALKNKDDIIKKYKKLLDEKGEEVGLSICLVCTERLLDDPSRSVLIGLMRDIILNYLPSTYHGMVCLNFPDNFFNLLFILFII